MKKRIILLTVFALLLAACGNSKTVSTSTNESLPFTTQLLLGTLQLQDTEQAVTSEQAKELLPMWQVYRELIGSSTAAQEEIDGLIDQIQETMTNHQKDAITTMGLTQSDVFSFMQTQGVGMGGSQPSSSGSSVQSNTGFVPPDGGMAGGPPDAGMAGGGPPESGFADLGGAGPIVSTDQSQVAEADTSAGRSAGVPNILVDTLIQYLEQIANS